jgi:hypothetical protein
MTEDDFVRRIIDTAHLYHWKVTHFRPARTERGWRTPVQGDAGFVDLVLAKAGQVLLVEVKTDRGRVRPDQLEWAMEIGPSYRLWRPADWDQILLELRSRHPIAEDGLVVRSLLA